MLAKYLFLLEVHQNLSKWSRRSLLLSSENLSHIPNLENVDLFTLNSYFRSMYKLLSHCSSRRVEINWYSANKYKYVK